MTDSMKFGPEWLRNMSADSASSNSLNSSSHITNSAGGFSLSGSSGDTTSNNNNCINSNSSNLNSTNSNLHNNGNSANLGALRNTFPEFRYGREEMLLLFDRNCGVPEILPSFKHLFVEKTQFPLALVPSTDEDLMQGSVPPTQRPGWLQRSPVGFSTTIRGTGRVGCMERGRLRGKSIYHPVFQRPNAMFEDDQRSSGIKTERPWNERNGGVVASDATVSGNLTTAGGLGSSDAWNGNTPASSPRREFSNHPRNIENWRRGRNEDGSGSGDPGPNATSFSAEGGWRINSSGFQNSHTRWGRSTSWRDDDLTNNNDDPIISTCGNTVGIGSSGMIMTRSNSAIATTQGDRLGHSGASGKQSINAPGIGVTRSISMTSSGHSNSSIGNIWPNNSNSQISNTQVDSSGIDDMTLPEWAMENPSDIGGTFDSSGAFHGTIDDEENLANDSVVKRNDTADQSESSPCNEEKDTQEKPYNQEDPAKSQKSLKEADNCQESLPRSPTLSNTTASLEKSQNLSEGERSNQNTLNNNTPDLEKNIADNSKNEFNESGKNSCTATNTISTVQNYETGKLTSVDSATSSSNAGDYAERMMKVTDDMIEKLIMDDEDSKDDHIKLSSGNKITSQLAFVSALQQSQSSNQHPSTVSPALGPASAGPPNMGVYNMTGIMVDHAHNMTALHQLQQQQMAAVAAAAIGLQPSPAPPPHPITSTSPIDLWLYRDPQAKVQGPFSALEMTEWYRAGYFNENLFVRRVCDARFRPLGELIKICNGQMPFSHSHLISIDLNPTVLTPPLPSVLSSSAQATDFAIKTLSEHHQQQHEKLKGNVTAAADSLSNALKSLINSVDISQVLNMHFQTLQDRFIHNQEMEIINELSKNECFQRLSAAEQDAVVRQKLQMMVLPEYLTNLTGLSNSLALLNPSAGTQLYDTIAECTKKEQLFSGNPQAQTPAQAQQQQRNNHHGSSSTLYMNAEDFTVKNKKTNQDIGSNDLLNEFHLRMFLNNGSDTAGGSGSVATPNSHGHEFLNEQPIFGAGAAVSGSLSTPSAPGNASQSPMMQMWMNSLATKQTNSFPSQQHQLVTSVQQSGGVNNQWLNGPLVGIPTISLSRDQHSGGSIICSPKPSPASMWDVATLEQHVQVQQQQQQQQQQQHHDQQLQQQLQRHKSFEHQHHLQEAEKTLQQDHVLLHDVNKQSHQKQNVEKNKQEHQHQKSNELQKTDENSTKSFNDSSNSKPDQQHRQSQQGTGNEKQNQLNKRYSNNNNNAQNNNGSKPINKVSKNENTDQTTTKKSEEERRREQNEEKRRQKEERKRQQIEEDKRRVMQAEEEKRRQLQEEEKRQQQIQAQRRKALMSNNNNTSNNMNNNGTLSSPNSNQKPNKEQHRIQSSVAPWCTQTMASKSQGPGLAEIQKAERRERRADQQRQLEIQERQMRALAAATEVQDTVLKWNAAPVPVKSFAEIQAEEAKRLAHEQMELQRRKEQEAPNNIPTFSSGASTISGALSNSSNVSSIWSGNKIWGTASNTTGFWEEPFKYNNKTVGSGLSASSSGTNSNSNLTAALIASQSLNTQKSTLAQMPTASTSQQQNIKKSQSVAVMQNSASSFTANISGGSNNQKKSNNLQSKAKSHKYDSTGVGGNEKKSVGKSNNTNTAGNNRDDYEAEFISWCTKSLNNMNTKVDVPTFVSFLRDLESPYEVKDYIRMYLGESKEYIDFAKQFLERRSKYKNLQRAQNIHDDDLCKPAQAITPSVNDNSDSKGKQKKIKKNKMTKLDARILGFSVTAAEGRINVGDRDYGDAP